MKVSIGQNIQEIEYNLDANSNSPFVKSSFFYSLESSKSIGKDSGWDQLYFSTDKSFLYTFIKSHSYGEYIFDWDWANFYHQYQVNYYPKLTSMIPFTSATVQHLLGEERGELMRAYEEFYSSNAFSSSHFLFIKKSEISFFESFNYLIRHSFQYHFFNDNYKSFDDFLKSLKSRKAKQIRKERKLESDLSIQRLTKDDLTSEHAKEMYLFYLSTISNKNAIPYLKEDFFVNLFLNASENVLYVRASLKDDAVAGALYLYSGDKLYGRYWGTIRDIPNLHFELCYYQGIEFTIENKFEVFEAGAQGEHKIPRGFKPVITYSAHKFKRAEFHQAISKYILDEKQRIDETIAFLSKSLPFKALL